MRPTLLGFRSVKEKTPLSYDARNTYDGRFVNFNSPKGNFKTRTFSCERRFIAYDILAKRTGYRVGPGSYSPELYQPIIRSGSPYKELHNSKNTANNGYYMVGSVIEFDPNLMLNSNKKLQKHKNIRLDSTYLNSRVSKSIETTNHSITANQSIVKDEDSFTTRIRFNKIQSQTGSTSKKYKGFSTRKGKIQEMLKKRFNSLKF